MRKTLFGVLFIFINCLNSWILASENLRWSEKKQSFTVTHSTSKLTGQFVLFNNDALDSLFVDNIRISCGCTKILISGRWLIPPISSLSIPWEVDLENFVGKRDVYIAILRQFSSESTAVSDSVQIQINVVPPITAIPENIFINGNMEEAQPVVVKAIDGLEILDVEAYSPTKEVFFIVKKIASDEVNILLRSNKVTLDKSPLIFYVRTSDGKKKAFHSYVSYNVE